MQLYNKRKQYNYHMIATTQIAHSTIEQLLAGVEKEINLKEVLKMAPKVTAQSANSAIRTMVLVTFSQYKESGRLLEERDPIPASIDSFGTGKIIKEQPPEKSRVDNKLSRVDDRARSLATQRSKKSFRSNKFAPQVSFRQATQIVKQKTSNQQSFFVSLFAETEIDGVEQNMRLAENTRVDQEEKLNKKREEERREREKNVLASQKLIREKRSLTFDYEGISQGINPSKLAGDTVSKLKETLRQAQIIRNEKMAQTTHIQSNKSKDYGSKSLRGEVPVFSEKSFSVVEALGGDSNVSQGVKITEIRGGSNNVTLEHKAKKSDGMKMYRLKDYKNLSKDQSFREFPKTTSRKSSLLDLSNSQIDKSSPHLEDEKLKTIRKERPAAASNGKSQELMKGQKVRALEDALGRGLPFIRTKGLKFYDIGSTSSFKTVDFNFNSSQRKSNWRSRIKISDTQLYEDILLS